MYLGDPVGRTRVAVEYLLDPDNCMRVAVDRSVDLEVAGSPVVRE